MHALDDRANLGIARRPLQTIFEQGGDYRMALDQRQFASQTGQDERIAPQTCRGVEHDRANAGLNPDSLGNHLPAAAAKKSAMGDRAFDKIDP